MADKADTAMKDAEAKDTEKPKTSLYSAKKKGPVFKRRTKKKAATDEEGGGSGMTGAQLRIERDLADLELPDNAKIVKVPGKWNQFSIFVAPREGSYWYIDRKKVRYEFQFIIPAKYPFDGPKVTCQDKIYHPNIDLEGKVCVNVLRPWKPTYSVQIILFGILFLFSHPNPNDPLNIEATEVMRKDVETFARNVSKSLQGSSIGGVRFPKNRGLE